MVGRRGNKTAGGIRGLSKDLIIVRLEIGEESDKRPFGSGQHRKIQPGLRLYKESQSADSPLRFQARIGDPRWYRGSFRKDIAVSGFSHFERGQVKQFLTVPVGAETCGPTLLADGTSVFVAVQHPGEVSGASVENPASTWPDGRFPRPPEPVAENLADLEQLVDESGADLNTCMDYSNALDNPSPNAHDYEQLETIYNSHYDAGFEPSFTPPSSNPLRTERADNMVSSHVVQYYGNGYELHTFITWALPH